MIIAPLPTDESARLTALRHFDILDTDPENAYDDIVRLAAYICDTPIAAVTLIDAQRQWFKSRLGLSFTETSRDMAFCAHTILQQGLMVVSDASLDPRFADNPLVTGEPHLRFYAGVPLVPEGRHALGALCIMDYVPRTLTPEQEDALRLLARHVAKQMELAQQAAENKRLIAERELASEMQRASDESLRQLGAAVQSTTEGIVIADARQPDCPITYANPAFLSLTGYDLSEVVGHNCRFLQGADTDPDARQQLRKAICLGLPARVTLLNYRKDGSAFWNELTIAPVRADDEALNYFIGIQHDATALKEAELALLQSNTALQANQARLVEAQRIGGIGDWELDLATRHFTWSTEAYRIMEFDPAAGEPPYEAVMARYHPEDRAVRDLLFQQALETGKPYQCDLRLLLPSGTARWCHLVGRPLLSAEGTVTRIIGTVADITERKLAEAERIRLSDYNRLLLESTAEGIYGVDREGCCTFINKAACYALGYSSEDVIGRNMHALIHHTRSNGSPYPEQECPIFRAFQEGVACHDETEVLWRRNRTFFPAAYSAYPIWDTLGVIGAVVTFTDITERKEREQQVKEANIILEVQKTQLQSVNAELESLATTDHLTGLPNHRAFQSRLAEEAARAEQEGTTLALAVMDLDSFKFFNDVYGHSVGDHVLRYVADRLRQIRRPGETVARFGGDEFAVILPDVGGVTAAEVEARLRADLFDLAYQPHDQITAIPLTISMGAALYARGGQDRHEALRQADERLRRAKTGGDVDTEADKWRVSVAGRVTGFSMLDALVTAVDNKDRYTRRHSEDVLDYSLLIARTVGMDERNQRTIAVAALLHDVGKIGVPDAILRKPGKLDDDEFAAIKQHPTMGAIIVQAVPGLDDTLDAVRHHHERWDGQGYPFGLKGEETPVIARLMAVADAYSAMTTDRPYRKGMKREKALSILAGGSGTQWDPTFVAAFLRALPNQPGIGS